MQSNAGTLCIRVASGTVIFNPESDTAVYLGGPWPPPSQDLPPGQIRLIDPLLHALAPCDLELDRELEHHRNRLRLRMQQKLREGDSVALSTQAGHFSYYVCKLLWQRGFREPSSWRRLRDVSSGERPSDNPGVIRIDMPVGQIFASRESVGAVKHIYERDGDAQLRVALASLEFDFCGPNTRVRRGSDDIVVSLRPVVDALLMDGLWIDWRADERFRDLARVMVQLGRAEHRHVGRIEFARRWSRGKQ